LDVNPKTLTPDTEDTKTRTLQKWKQAINHYSNLYLSILTKHSRNLQTRSDTLRFYLTSTDPLATVTF